MQSHSDILRQIPKVDLILSLLPEALYEQLDDSIIKETGGGGACGGYVQNCKSRSECANNFWILVRGRWRDAQKWWSYLDM